jgi:hypothetical protein
LGSPLEPTSPTFATAGRTGRIVIFRPPPHGNQREAEPANIFAIRLSKDAGTSTSTFTTTLVTASHSSIDTDIESHAFTNAAIDDTNCELAARLALLPFVAILLIRSRSHLYTARRTRSVRRNAVIITAVAAANAAATKR